MISLEAGKEEAEVHSSSVLLHPIMNATEGPAPGTPHWVLHSTAAIRYHCPSSPATRSKLSQADSFKDFRMEAEMPGGVILHLRCRDKESWRWAWWIQMRRSRDEWWRPLEVFQFPMLLPFTRLTFLLHPSNVPVFLIFICFSLCICWLHWVLAAVHRVFLTAHRLLSGWGSGLSSCRAHV